MPEAVMRHGILVSSTTDLIDERRAVVEAIVEWNEANWNGGLVFTPLLWESGAVADSTVPTPHDAIKDQLFSKASGMLTLFKHRLGLGTRQEIEEALNRNGFLLALFFSGERVPIDLLDERKALQEWRKKVPGLHIEYEDTEQLKNRVKAQLHEWATKLRRYSDSATGLAAEIQEADNYQAWHQTWNPERSSCTLLLYNVELETFKTADQFTNYWSHLADEPHVEKIVLLLPSYKLRRLQDYLRDWTHEGALKALHNRVFVCRMSTSESEHRKIATSTAFCLLRKGSDPASGSALPGARVFTLSEPFSRPQGKMRPPEIVWQYKHSFITQNEEVLRSLLEIWDDSYTNDALTSLEHIRVTDTNADPPQIEVDLTVAPSDRQYFLSDLKQLRERLFDPNVPSYLLDPKFFILDWNPAFEMVFPTELFYRHEHVKEFVQCLSNKDDLIRTGVSFESGQENEWLHMEPLYYQSPLYGDMAFTKVASHVYDPVHEKDLGYCVALHVNHVQDLERYTTDLHTVNQIDHLHSMYARAYRHIVARFPPYQQLIQRHVEALASCHQILDAGCGPGTLTLALLKAGKTVTAVDSNDRMLELARETVGQLPEDCTARLSIVKANVETLHRPSVFYTRDTVGIQQGYDGLALLNAFHSLSDPGTALKRIKTDLLAEESLLAMSLPSPNTRLDVLLSKIQDHGEEIRKKTGADPWNSWEWSILTQVNRTLFDQGMLTRNSHDFKQILDDAGFTVELEEECYAGQGIFVVARTK